MAIVFCQKLYPKAEISLIFFMKTGMTPQKLLNLKKHIFLSDYFFHQKIHLRNSSDEWTSFVLLYPYLSEIRLNQLWEILAKKICLLFYSSLLLWTQIYVWNVTFHWRRRKEREKEFPSIQTQGKRRLKRKFLIPYSCNVIPCINLIYLYNLPMVEHLLVLVSSESDLLGTSALLL